MQKASVSLSAATQKTPFELYIEAISGLTTDSVDDIRLLSKLIFTDYCRTQGRD